MTAPLHWENRIGGVIEVANSDAFNLGAMEAHLINQGTFRYSGSEPVSLFFTSVFSSGFCETTGGAVVFNGPVSVGGVWRSVQSGERFTFNQDTSLQSPAIEGPGLLVFRGGNLLLNDSNLRTNVVLSGAELTGTNRFHCQRKVETGVVAGELEVATDGKLLLAGIEGGNPAAISGRLVNHGRVVVALSSDMTPITAFGTVQWDNLPGGVIEVMTRAFFDWRGDVRLNNQGTFRYVGTAPLNLSFERLESSGLFETTGGPVVFDYVASSPTMGASSVLRAGIALESAGTARFQWQTGGAVWPLAGRLEVLTRNGFSPAPGQKFMLINVSFPGSYSGRFENRATAVVAGFYYALEYAPQAVLLAAKTAPVAVADAVELLANSATNVAVLANDTDADGDILTVASFTQGTHGSVSANADGTLRYTPALGYVGADSFTYTVADAFAVTSTATVTVTVLPVPPLFTQQPANQTVAPGATATFTAAATGVPLPALQWHFAEAPLPGQMGGTLTVTGASAANEGLHFVVASNAAGSITSAPARLRLMPVPWIVTPPVSRVVGPGTEVVLSVSATSGSGLNFQWRFNGENLPGATGDSFTLPAAEAANVGRYTVVVSNQAGSAESTPATVSLIDVATFVGTIISGPVGASYRVEVREALDPEDAWQPAATLTLTESPTVWLDRNSPKDARRFYRAILLNP